MMARAQKEIYRKKLLDIINNPKLDDKRFGIDSSVAEDVLFDRVKLDNGEIVKAFAPGITKDVISRLDFSGVSFDNVQLAWGDNLPIIGGIDFTGSTGVMINPQTVYDKFLEDSIFNGVTFVGSFEGVNIKGANFKGSRGAVINPQHIYGKTLEGCVLSDTVINGPLNGVNINNTSFINCKGAILDKEDVAEHIASGENILFDGLEVIGDYRSR